MEKHLVPSPTSAFTPSSAQVFVSPHLLPEGMRLLFDLETRIAIFLSLERDEPSCQFRTFPLTPSATQVFLALLQAYPRPCTHQALFHALYPGEGSKHEQEWAKTRDLAIPLIRRALKSLLPALRGCGLRAVSLRGQGYVLTRGPQTETG